MRTTGSILNKHEKRAVCSVLTVNCRAQCNKKKKKHFSLLATCQEMSNEKMAF